GDTPFLWSASYHVKWQPAASSHLCVLAGSLLTSHPFSPGCRSPPELQADAADRTVEIPVRRREAVAGADVQSHRAGEARHDLDFRLPDEEAFVEAEAREANAAPAIDRKRPDERRAVSREAVRRDADGAIVPQPPLRHRAEVPHVAGRVRLKVAAETEQRLAGKDGASVRTNELRRLVVHFGDAEVGREREAVFGGRHLDEARLSRRLRGRSRRRFRRVGVDRQTDIDRERLAGANGHDRGERAVALRPDLDAMLPWQH